MAEKPYEIYQEIIKSVKEQSTPQTEQDMFNLLKALATRGQNALDVQFKIPLDLIPEFDVNVFSYLFHADETLDLYLPDVSLSLNNVVQEPRNGMYSLSFTGQSNILKVKYNEQVYTIIALRKS